MSQLFSATHIGRLALENRIVMSPMCQYSANEGKATAWHRIHLGQLALSGAGLLIIEATAVEAIGHITPSDLGLWDDETEAALRMRTGRYPRLFTCHARYSAGSCWT